MLNRIISFLAPVRANRLGRLDPLDVLVAETFQERKQNDCLPFWYQRYEARNFTTVSWITAHQKLPKVINRLPRPGVR